MFGENPQLAPDLEWMLQSGQVNREILIEALVDEYYAPIFRLALHILDDPGAARTAALDTFASAILKLHLYRGKASAQTWLYQIALETCRKAHQRLSLRRAFKANLPLYNQPSDFGYAVPKNELEAVVWLAVDALDYLKRVMVLLYYVNGWQAEDIGKLFEGTAQEVQVELNRIRRRLAQAPGKEELRAALQNQGAKLEDEIWSDAEESVILTDRLMARLDEVVKQALDKRWPVLELSEDESQEIARRIAQRSSRKSVQRRLRTTVAELSLVSLVILAVGSLLWGADLLQPEAMPTPNATQQVKVQAIDQPIPTLTPVPPAPEAKPLSIHSQASEVQQRLQESIRLWNTLWADVQIVEYGPPNYIGPPRIYRSQVWISQPDKSLELFGLFSDKPSLVQLVTDGKSTIASLQRSDKAYTEKWDGSTENLLQNAWLRDMFFPNQSSWVGDGDLIAIQTGQMDGRQVVIYEWTGRPNQGEAQLWVDASTGLILRLRHTIDGTLLTEVVVDQLALDKEFPDPALFDPVQLYKNSFAVDYHGKAFPEAAQAPTPSLAVDLQRRRPLPLTPASPGASLAQSYLVFQFPQGSGTEDLSTNTTGGKAELLADGLWLGSLDFGWPWNVQCVRSQDGQRIAFDIKSDGVTKADYALRWLNLAEPDKVYRPMPGFNALAFAFAPDQRQIAVAGYWQDNGKPPGIYLLDITTNESQLLIELADAHGLTWNPVGNYLAWVGTIFGEDTETVMMMHLPTRQIVFQQKLSQFLNRQDAPQWPVEGWNVKLPADMGSMGTCARPPVTPEN